jgi:hypothetical protein
MTIRVMKTTTPTVAPTITPMGLVVEDGDEEEAAGRGGVILNPISFTQKKSAASGRPVGLGIVVVDIVMFIWSGIYPIVGSEPWATDVEPL